MSMDTTMKERNNTDATIYGTSNLSGRTESLLSDPNIASSPSTSADDHHQQILRAPVDCTDDLTVSVSSSSSRIKEKEQQVQLCYLFRLLEPSVHLEFGNMVRRLYIYTSEEVKKLCP
ncbi:hypothetical protein K7X08_024533 [Anisodus acutangulus]|uniref:Uncharacterized protein n=1 Tax=Anisodus acutangulus TaxID=402998 RepID=A0A9Q1MCY7_9SOLA|nr:hypothetical protein K7X08_024533 [Anisodus acutangulus]